MTTALDAAVLQAIRHGDDYAGAIETALLDVPWDQVEASLQRLRKAGVIQFNKEKRRWEVKP